MTPATLYDFIKSIHPLPEEDYALLTETLRSKQYAKGESLVAIGQLQKEIYFVKQGVQMYSFEVNGKINILGFSYPPFLAAIPESFFMQKPATYSLTCLTDSEVDYLTFSELEVLFTKSRQLERWFRKLAESLSVGLINRQIELRSTTIEERFMAFCRRSPHLLQLVPHKYIASYLAIDPTNFSKLFNSIKF